MPQEGSWVREGQSFTTRVGKYNNNTSDPEQQGEVTITTHHGMNSKGIKYPSNTYLIPMRYTHKIPINQSITTRPTLKHTPNNVRQPNEANHTRPTIRLQPNDVNPITSTQRQRRQPNDVNPTTSTQLHNPTTTTSTQRRQPNYVNPTTTASTQRQPYVNPTTSTQRRQPDYVNPMTSTQRRQPYYFNPTTPSERDPNINESNTTPDMNPRNTKQSNENKNHATKMAHATQMDRACNN
eukprot:1368532-Amorphochlora_amoeboformis.AAC.1